MLRLQQCSFIYLIFFLACYQDPNSKHTSSSVCPEILSYCQIGIADLLIFAMHIAVLLDSMNNRVFPLSFSSNDATVNYVDMFYVLLNIWRYSTLTGIIASNTCLMILFPPPGFCFKPFKYCQDFILANETNCILMSQNNIMLSLYSSLAIWYARLQEWDKFIIPFEKARRLVRRTCASLCSNHGFCKLVECETLLLRKYIEERPDKVREMHNRITKNLDQIMNQCSISPVYYSRVYHLKAYVQLMLGNDELSQTFLEKGFYSSDIYGNRLERSWLEISKEWWFTGKKPMEDFWLKAVPDFPVWNVNMTAQEMGAFYKNMYLLKVPELDISNPLPESSIEEEY